MKSPDLLTQPESKTLEFKRDLSSPKHLLKTIVAFANTAGGTLVIGRSDNGTIVGVDDVLAAEERMANWIADGISPAMMPDIDVVTVDDKSLLLVQVAHWPGPFYVKDLGFPDGVYVRLGSTNRRADASVIDALQRQRQHASFDQLPCFGTSEACLDPLVVGQWFAERGRVADSSALESLGVLVRHGSERVVSNGGLILFGTPAVRRSYFPDAHLSAARFRGRDKAEFVDRKEMDGLFDALVEVPKFIARNTRLAARISGMKRKDIPEYSEVAIREVLVNAIAHADYACAGSRFFVSIFEDRLEIQSPGMLPFGMTLENLKAGVSRIRNRVVCRVLHEMELMEEWGSGYQRIVAACRNEGYPVPEWLEFGLCVRVVFRPHPTARIHDPVNDLEENTIDEYGAGQLNETMGVFTGLGRALAPHDPAVTRCDPVNDPVNERQQWFLTELRRAVPLNSENIVQHWGVSLSTAKRDIASLRKRGLIVFSGPAKTGSYRLSDNYERFT